MIIVPVAEDDKIQLLQIDGQRRDVEGKLGALSARIKQHSPAAILDKGGIAPAALEI